MSDHDRRPAPHLVGLGPDSTPPNGSDAGTAEQRLGAGIEGVHVDVRDLKVAIGVTQADVRSLAARLARLETMGARMLDGYHEILDALAGLRVNDKSRDAQIGIIVGELGRIATRLGIVERGPREGSSPALERLADLALEDLTTEVREKERTRSLAHANRKRAWDLTWRVLGVLAVGLAGYALARLTGQ